MGSLQTPLAGKTAEVLFDSGYHFKLDYHDGNRMTWTSLQRKDKGNTATEDIQITQTGDGLYTVHWLERDGIEVVHAIDINGGAINGVVTWPEEGAYGKRHILTHAGSYSFITKPGEADERPFTNLQIAAAFWEGFFNRHDESCIDEYIADSYIQHGPNGCRGPHEFRAKYAPLLQGGFRNFSAEIMHSACRENRVFIHSDKKTHPDAQGTPSVDIFRITDGKITERWVFGEVSKDSTL